MRFLLLIGLCCVGLGSVHAQGECMDEFKGMGECMKGVFKGIGPPPELVQRVLGLKKQIIDQCFESNGCQKPKEAMANFAQCMIRGAIGEGGDGPGVIPRFGACLESRLELTPALKEKMLSKAQKMILKVLNNGADGIYGEESNEAKMEAAFMMMMKMGKEDEGEVMARLANAVCPDEESADSTVACVQQGLQDNGIVTQGSVGGVAFLKKLPEAKACACDISEDCKGKMEEGMVVACACKDRILGDERTKRELTMKAGLCAEVAGINPGIFQDFLAKLDKKISKLCGAGSKIMKKWMKCA